MKHAGAVFAGGRVTSGGKKLTSEKRKPKKPLEALNKGLSLSLDSGRIRLCEALSGLTQPYSEAFFL